MSEAAERIDGAAGGALLLCDHASNHVPVDVDLGIDPALLNLHIAYDIGAGALTRTLAASTGWPAVLGTVSRLVIDLHREPDRLGLIPMASDGHDVPGNRDANAAQRIARFHRPYHCAVASAVRLYRPDLIVAIHSFTPRLETAPVDRPWTIGVLYNRDRWTGEAALAALTAQGLSPGDNQPYSGRDLNTTINRHAEAAGIAGIAIEVRNDQLLTPAGIDAWASHLSEMIATLRNRVASRGHLTT
ncbi:N-formylglutamate amidohydrolase [Sphingomonas sp. BGYR3]|uniref:N-formylglutamate amidohydrolase n=1 Tax=Sphingomonas sp. BGYR3 TaxID=2975483 RepID=UPI0021A399F4|nr:N-formylglutamate amidohydrolase [Sphingomonas sp. BGYR3]MDG5487356.1 N-formylglutamate amidohydrolase [Sphingomonas sp. BGYR3]